MSKGDTGDDQQLDIAMFPLGSVLVPGMVLPLHVFEPRYRELVKAVTAGTNQFGVALIERGSEVGGQDVRVDVGCLAEIAQAEEFGDGRWAIVAVGVERVRITAWLPDDPYPRATIEPWPDDPETGDVQSAYEAAIVVLRRALALATELGAGGAPIPEAGDLADDPGMGSFHITALAPLGPVDRQRLLCAPGTLSRLEMAQRLLREQAEMFEAQIALADDDNFDPPASG